MKMNVDLKFIFEILKLSPSIFFVTPACNLSLIAAFWIGPEWILFGIIAGFSRLFLSLQLTLDFTARNISRAANYLSDLRKRGYDCKTAEFGKLFPEIPAKYTAATEVVVIIARPINCLWPLTHYATYSLPMLNKSIVFLGEEPGKMGSILYLQALHEIGHAVTTGWAHTLDRVNPVLQLWVVYFPIFLLASPSRILQIAVALFAIWHLFLRNRIDYAETSADMFATEIFDLYKGAELRSSTVAAMARYWEGCKDIEKENRLRILQQPFGYTPSKIIPINRGGFKIDELAVRLDSAVKTGPLFLCFIVVSLHFSYYAGSYTGFLMQEWGSGATLSLLPFVIIQLILCWYSYRQVVQQFLNLSWIESTCNLTDIEVLLGEKEGF